MSESSQQEFFLEHFQKVRELLEGGEVREALGVMLDVRENGFVNKELDTMIDALRDEPADEVVDEALHWSKMISDRLTSFGGDVFQLVEEFSEASLGLSEAEWVPVESKRTKQQVSSDSDDLLSMDFGDLEDLEDVGSQEIDIDLDFSDDEAWGDLDDLDELSDLEEFSDLDELSDLEEISDLDEPSSPKGADHAQFDEVFGQDGEGARLDESDPPSVDFALVEGSFAAEASEASDDEMANEPDDVKADEPAELGRQEQETKPHPSVADEERQPSESPLRQTAKQSSAERLSEDPLSAEQQAVDQSVEDAFDGFRFDDSEGSEEDASDSDAGGHSFVSEATRRSDSLDEMLTAKPNGGAVERAGTPAPEPVEHDAGELDVEDDDDDFDFDLGFENPASRIETPSSQPEDVAQEAHEDDEDDDFDFDFGFENPESRVEMPDVASTPSEPAADEAEEVNVAEEVGSGEEAAGEEVQDEDFDFDLGFENPNSRTSTPTGTPFSPPVSAQEDPEEEEEFDLDFGFENPESKNSNPGRLGGGSISGTSDVEHDLDFEKGRLQADGGSAAEQGSGSGSHRDPEATPASMPSIPRFRPPTDEETSPRDDASSSEVGDSLDDDEFFELAESLTGESSEESAHGPYRGEPLMNSSNTPVPKATPTPIPQAGSELSEVSQGRERADTPNPFAHEAPTGVQRALVDSHSSFVLEEIRESEVSEAQEGEAAVGALMTEARRLYEKGKFESAHDLLEAVLERKEANDEAQELMGTVEGELERQHQAALGSLSKVPELKVTMSDIPNMNLDHRFGYLLSQIDGMSTFEDILELSSMTRLETLEVLVQMLDRDIIAVN